MSDPQTVEFPPKGFVPAPSAVEGVEVFVPSLSEDHLDKVVAFRCPNCGGHSAYDIGAEGLTCTSCGHTEAIDHEVVGRSAEAQDFRVEAPSPAIGSFTAPIASSDAPPVITIDEETPVTNEDEPTGHSELPETHLNIPVVQVDQWHSDRQMLECNNCRAGLLLEDRELTKVCPFCASEQIVQHQFDVDQMRPGYMIPFKVLAEPAVEQIRAWFASNWFVPNDLEKRAHLDELVGIYVPYWTFSAHCAGEYQARVGTNHTRTDSKGNTRTYTTWEWKSGSYSLQYVDILVVGSSQLHPKVLPKVEAKFHMRDLVEYDPSFLAGFNAQTYEVERDDAWQLGQDEMRSRIKTHCRRELGGDKVEKFTMTCDFDDERWRYVLLPLYVTSFRYEDELYQVLINGQSGHLAGQRPIDWRKFTAVVVAIIVLAILAIVFFLSQFENRGILMVPLVGGGAAIFALYSYIQNLRLR